MLLSKRVAACHRSSAAPAQRAVINRRALKVQAVAAPFEDPEADFCPIFMDPKGKVIQPMCADYGFRAGGGRLYQEHYGEVPDSIWSLGKANFTQELTQLRRSVRYNQYKEVIGQRPPDNFLAKISYFITNSIVNGFGALDEALEKAGALSKLEPTAELTALRSEEFIQIRQKLDKLKLTNDEVHRYEKARIARTGDLVSPVWVKLPFDFLCIVLDVVYDKRPIQKFWVLETVARIPYFACISILHLYESLGLWRAGAELRRIHFAEEWNEMHHLQIMESLGGDQAWFDRFLAEHMSIAYYWVLVAFYLFNPKAAYNFMQRVELHAADTYCAFVDENREVLKQIPPPMVALNYYLNGDLYLFDEFQTASKTTPRRPSCNTLLDVFENIRDDEFEHVKTCVACQDESIAKDLAQMAASKKGGKTLNAAALSEKEPK